jgi:hypothetical protein
MAFSVNKMATFLGLKDDPELDQVAVAQEPVRTGAVSVREPRGAAVRNVASRPIAVAVQPELSPMDRIVTLHAPLLNLCQFRKHLEYLRCPQFRHR